jgi:hypothetical protein
VGGLNVLGTLDVLTYLANTLLGLRFERQWRRSRHSNCSLMADLAEHTGQLSAPLLSDFASYQSAFRLKVPQGTPPFSSGKLSELEGIFLTEGKDYCG